MKQATINLAEGGFGRSAAGLVYAELSLHVDDLQFPDSQWTDFVVVVLMWWCSGLSRLLDGESEPIAVRFMEGPYLVELGPINDERLHLVLVEDGLKRRIWEETDADARTLIRSVLSAAERTLTKCKDHGWWSDDATNLSAATNDLRRALREQ
jgi:hypothetical protein